MLGRCTQCPTNGGIPFSRPKVKKERRNKGKEGKVRREDPNSQIASSFGVGGCPLLFQQTCKRPCSERDAAHCWRHWFLSPIKLDPIHLSSRIYRRCSTALLFLLSGNGADKEDVPGCEPFSVSARRAPCAGSFSPCCDCFKKAKKKLFLAWRLILRTVREGRFDFEGAELVDFEGGQTGESQIAAANAA